MGWRNINAGDSRVVGGQLFTGYVPSRAVLRFRLCLSDFVVPFPTSAPAVVELENTGCIRNMVQPFFFARANVSNFFCKGLPVRGYAMAVDNPRSPSRARADFSPKTRARGEVEGTFALVRRARAVAPLLGSLALRSSVSVGTERTQYGRCKRAGEEMMREASVKPP